MGNKVVRIQDAEVQLSSADYQPTFLDVSMESERNLRSGAEISCPDINDYITYLKADTDDSSLSAIVVDPLSSETDVIKQIAFLLNTNYYSEYIRYQQYIRQTQYKIASINDVQATKNSLHNIFTWTPGQRILNPDFGSRLDALLYEGMTEQNKERIVAEIRTTALQWEPRVRIIDIVDMTDIQEAENNTVHLEVLFTIPALTEGKQYSETLLYNTTQI